MTSDRTPEYLAGLVRELCKLPRETEWLEFKGNNADPQEIGEYLSALANSAAYNGNKAFAYLVQFESACPFWGGGAEPLHGLARDPGGCGSGPDLARGSQRCSQVHALPAVLGCRAAGRGGVTPRLLDGYLIGARLRGCPSGINTFENIYLGAIPLLDGYLIKNGTDVLRADR